MTEPLNLEALRARNAEREKRKAAATPGPWRSTWEVSRYGPCLHGDDDNVIETESGELVVGMIYYDGWWPACSQSNAAFIAAARNDTVEADISDLIAEVVKLREQVAQQASALDIANKNNALLTKQLDALIMDPIDCASWASRLIEAKEELAKATVEARRWRWCEAHLLQECADEYWMDTNGRDLTKFVDAALAAEAKEKQI